MNIAVIWNKNEFSDAIEASPWWQTVAKTVIADADAYRQFREGWDRYDALVLLCELDWHPDGSRRNMADLEGCVRSQELRSRDDLTIPIIFVSFLPLQEVITPEREILLTVGHGFCQLPVSPSQLLRSIRQRFEQGGGLKKLSDQELNDIKSFYCDRQGLLAYELHRHTAFRGFTLTDGNSAWAYRNMLDSIIRMHRLANKDGTEESATFRRHYPSLTADNLQQAVSHIVWLGNRLLEDIVQDKETLQASTSEVKPHPWKILLLDDEIGEDHLLVRTAKANGIRMICTHSVKEASRVLREDWESTNSIMVVVADYRLYETVDGVRRHQEVQGYTFLSEIAASDHLVRLIAFSGLGRKFLLDSFRNYKIRTEVKSKADYLVNSNTLQLFCEELIVVAKENIEAIEALPSKCAGFAKHLQAAYIAFRQDPAYLSLERVISLEAKTYIRTIQQQVAMGEEPAIRAIEHIKSPLSRSKQDKDNSFRRLQHYFVARRIALWLYAMSKKPGYRNISPRRIAEILTGRNYPTDAYRQILSTNLGLSLEDFPNNITIEERLWLQLDMQLDLFLAIRSVSAVFSQLSALFGEFIRNDKACAETLTRSAFTISHPYRKSAYLLNFDTDFAPKLKTATDVRVCYLWLSGLLTRISPGTTKDHLHQRDLLGLVSRIRIGLLGGSEGPLFRYFNVLFGALNGEQGYGKNPSRSLKTKDALAASGNGEIDQLFEQVFQTLKDQSPVTSAASADFMLLYSIGFEVRHQLGELTASNKAFFFKMMIDQYNDDFQSSFTSLDDFTLDKRSAMDFWDEQDPGH